MPESYDVVQGAYVAASLAVIGTLQPRPYDRIIKRIVIVGPTGSKFSLYSGFTIADSYQLTTTNRGARNTANLSKPILISANETAKAVWTSGATTVGSTSTMTIWYDWEIP